MSTGTATYIYDEDIQAIDKIELNIWDNLEILDYSSLDKNTVGIDVPDLYENMEPKRGGLIDTRLGITDPSLDCTTCGLRVDRCVGHFGHIKLTEPVYHMGFIRYVQKILSCICLRCSRLLISKNEDELIDMLKNKTSNARFNEIRNLVKNVSYCSRTNNDCNTPVSKIKLDIKKNMCTVNMVAETDINVSEATDDTFGNKKKVQKLITPDMCYDILKNISDQDCLIMGINPKKSRPESMIHKVFPVPPVAVRPSAKADFKASSTMEDGLTHKLADIIKANIRIREYKEKQTENTVKHAGENVHLLQYHIATYYDNDSLSLPKSEQRGKPIKSLISRLKGKEGRIRGNLMGKRVDFSARTVITPDPTLDINELGVPIKIAKNITFPEVVTRYNIKKMQELVRNGREKYPGANNVFFIAAMIEENRPIAPKDLRFGREKIVLRYGDVVERHLVSGDYVLLNRQPSLHKLSMMGHRIKIINDVRLSTFRLNPYATTPYNADFDGDEMNIFVPQSLQTSIELDEIADVKRQIIAPGNSSPIIGAIQDGILGSYNISAPSVRIKWKDAMNIVSYTSISDFTVIKKNQEYKGTELFSLIIPSDINVDHAGLTVERGEIKDGRLKKAHVGGKANSLIHAIWNVHGIDATKDFIDNTARLINNFNLMNGFSVGIGDTLISEKLQEEMNKVFETKKLEVDHLVTNVENNPDLLDSKTFENSIYSELNAIRDNMSKLIMNNLMDDNGFYIMITSGSKGSELNMGQMSGCIGQQAVEGTRIKKKINYRTLPYFHQNDDSAMARGFVQSSYLQGATPTEFIFHNMGSREGLIDTAIKTAESGYVQRKLIKTMEDAMVKYDCTVRNANDTIIQFIYGDDGIDSTRQYVHVLKIFNMGNKELTEKYKFTDVELSKFKNYSSKDNTSHVKKIMELRDLIREAKIKTGKNYNAINTKVQLPINIKLIISNVSRERSDKTELSPDYIIQKLDSLLDYSQTKVTCMSKNSANNKSSLRYRDEIVSKTMFKMALYAYLSPKLVLNEMKLSKTQFDKICNKIVKDFNTSVVDAAEMVGIVAAQSIGEPVTQLTLNSIDWKDKIILREDGNTKIIEIGKYIDEYIEEHPEKVEHIDDNPEEEKADTYYIDISDRDVMAISVDKDGVVSWNKVTALTKHLPMNKDGTNDLVKVTTKLGRTITATKAKSFLTRVNNEIVPIRGDEIKVGTLLPIMMNYPKIKDPLTKLDMSVYFPKSEYIYSSEIEKARQVKKKANENGSRLWWKDNNGKLFTTPYSRQDSLKHVLDGKTKQVYEPNCVYPNKGRLMKAKFPEKMPLDKDFGFFIGAYLAEGLSTGVYTCISNNDKVYRQRIINFCDKYNMGYHIQEQKNKIQDGWTSTDIRIHCVLLAKLMLKICDTGSEHKYIPDWVYDANDEFVIGLLDGYFCGDGSVGNPDKGRRIISAYSISEKLIDGLILLLNRFNIISQKKKLKKQLTNNRGSKNIKQAYSIYISNENIHLFYSKIKLTLDNKNNRLKSISNYNFRRRNGMYDNIPGNKLSINEEDIIHRDELEKLIKHPYINDKEKNIVLKAINSDVYYDEISSIRKVSPSHTYVYDLTVANDKTFTMQCGLHMYDTFHFAGIGAKGTATLGVPRIKELLSFTKNIKTPIMDIYLEEKYKTDSVVANKIASFIKHTTVESIRERIDIYFDPDPTEKGGFMDRDNVHNIFHIHKLTKNTCQNDVTALPWLVRIPFNREKLVDKNITLIDIKSQFCSRWERIRDIKGIKKDEKSVIEKITQCAILSNNENSKVPIIHIRFDMTSFDLNTMIGFVDYFVDGFKLKGLNGITDVISIDDERIINYDNDDQIEEYETQKVIYTNGVNMIDIRYINGIDLNRTVSNDIVDIYNTLGIEAARTVLLKELKQIFSDIGFQHLSVLVDIMTNAGVLTSVDRHGLKRMETDPFGRASYERTVDQFLTAAVFNQVDNMNSVSSRTMAGQVIKGGTGLPNIILDHDLIENSEYIEELEEMKYKKTFTELSKSSLIDDVMNKEIDDAFMPN